MQKKHKKPDELTGNRSEAQCIQQGSKNEVCLFRGSSVEPFPPKNREDRTQGRIQLNEPLQFCTQVYSCASSNENLGCEDSRALEEWKKLETIPAWQLEKVKSKKEVILEAPRANKEAHFASLMDICHLKKCGVRTNISEVQRSSCTPR